jgi:hypothetical protein
MACNATQPQLLKTYSVIIMDLLPFETRSGKVDQTLLNTYIENTIQKVAVSYSGRLPGDDDNVNAEIVKIVEDIIKTPSLYISIQATLADILKIYIKSIHSLLSHYLRHTTDIELLIEKAINDVSCDNRVEEANIMDVRFRVGGEHSIRTLIIDNIEKAARMHGGRSKKRSTQHRRSYKRKTRKMNHRRKY